MKRIIPVVATLLLLVGLLAGCAQSGETQAASSSETSSSAAAAASSASTQSSEAAAPVATSEIATSELASSELASSEFASSEGASSEGATSEYVLAGPSGISEMNVPMQYITAKDLLAEMNAGNKDLLIVDLRKFSDSKGAHLDGSIFAPMNKAVDNNDYADAIANLTSALYDATGNEVGEGRKIVLVCYGGKKYAQAGTDILNALGADMESVYTLEGGMTAWTEAQNPTVDN